MIEVAIGNLVEGIVVLGIAGCLLYLIVLWIYSEASVEELEDQLLKIRGKDHSYISVCSIRDEYTLYKEAAKNNKYIMSYEDWLDQRIIIEGEDV